MKNHLITTVPETVMRVQHRLIFIGFKAPALHFFRAQHPPKLGDLCVRPACAFSLYSLRQCAVAQKEVVAGKWRNLIRRQLIADAICRFSQWLVRLRADLSGGSRLNAPIMNQSRRGGAKFHFSGATYTRKPCALFPESQGLSSR